MSEGARAIRASRLGPARRPAAPDVPDPWDSPAARKALAKQAPAPNPRRRPGADGEAVRTLGGALVRPPYSPTALLGLLEAVPVHAAACHQKAADAVGLGWTLRAKVPEADPDQHSQALAWLEELAAPQLLPEVLHAALLDRVAVGWAALEVVRDEAGRPAGLRYVPAHTLLRHADGVRVAHIRLGGQLTWFRIYGSEGEVDATTGVLADSVPAERRGSELIWIRAPTARSDYYGIPEWISAYGDLALAAAARDYQLQWFGNAGLPDYAVVITGADLAPDLEQQIADYFQTTLRAEPRGVLAIAIPEAGRPDARAEVRFERLSPEVRDASFVRLRELVAEQILMAHRVPPYRVGWARLGSLAGNAAEEMNEVYRLGVIRPLQLQLQHALAPLLREIGVTDWELVFHELDFTDFSAAAAREARLVASGLTTVDEARGRLGLPPLDPERYGDAGQTTYVSNDLVPVGPSGGQAPGPGALKRAERAARAIDDFADLVEGLRRALGEEGDTE